MFFPFKTFRRILRFPLAALDWNGKKIFPRTFSEHPRSKLSSVDLEKSNPVLSRMLSSTGQPMRGKGRNNNKWPIWTNQNEDCIVPSIFHDIIFRIKWSEPFRKSCAFHFWLWLVQTGHVCIFFHITHWFLPEEEPIPIPCHKFFSMDVSYFSTKPLKQPVRYI